MYQYKSAMVRLKGREAAWEDADLSTIDVNDVYRLYAKVILTLTHPSFSHDLFLDMDDARSFLHPSTRPRTIQQWFDSLGSGSLPHHEVAPVIRERVVYCADVYRAGYQVLPVNRNMAWNAQLPNADKNDLLLRRSDIDFTQLWPYCMVSVNGLFHLVGGSAEGLYVAEGGRSGRICNNNNLTLLSWRNVGSLQYVPIVSSMVHKTTSDQKYSDYVNVKLPAAVPGKTIMLVLGGYLHAMDEVYEQTGDQTVRININKVAYVQRVFDSLNRIDLDSLGLEVSPENNHQFSVSELLSDDAVKAYVTLPQSFFIIVDAPYLFVKEHGVEKTGMPGRFITEPAKARLPLFSVLGRNFPYHVRTDWGRAVLACEPARDLNLNIETVNWWDGVSVDDQTYAPMQWDHARANLWEIGTYSQEFEDEPAVPVP